MGERNPILVRQWLDRLAEQTGAFRVRSLRQAGSSGGPPSQLTSGYVATLAPTSGGSALELGIEARNRLTPAEAYSLIERHKRSATRDKEILLICCPNMSPRVTELCREAGINYLDGGGNCWISAPGLFLQISGNPKPAPETRPLVDPFAQKSSRIARVLLENTDRAWLVRDLAREADVSIGLASKARRSLLDAAYLSEENGRVMVRDPVALLRTWAARYREGVQSLFLYVMAETKAIENAVAEWCRGHHVVYAMSEFAGAWRVAPMVRYTRTTIRVLQELDRDVAAELAEHIGAKYADTGSNLTIWSTRDKAAFYRATTQEGIVVASPIQLYLDLARNRGRGEEAAEEMLDRIIQPRFRHRSTPGEEDSGSGGLRTE